MRPSRIATLAVIFAAVVGPLGGRAVAQTAAPDQGLVPLVAGVEHGKFMPSLTLAMGVRLPGGIEGGLGPNLQLFDPVSTGLVLGIGKSFDYGGVSIPVNLAYTINPMGNRVSVIIGYAIQRSSSRRARRR